jgi:hypothetical protein
MKKSLPVVLCFLLSVIYSGCGRKGVLQEPVPKVPQKVEDFAVIQRGGRLFFSWTNPESYLDGSQLEIMKAEIRALEDKGTQKSLEPGKTQFSRLSRLLTELNIGQVEIKDSRAILSLNVDRALGRRFIFGLRLRGKKGDWSDFSNLVELTPVVLALPPEELRAECFEDRIYLGWQLPDYSIDRKTPVVINGFNIYRSEDHDFQKINPDIVEKPAYEDRNFSFGQTYNYLVRAVCGTGADLRESEDSAAVQITPQDIFPPAPPAEVQAVVSQDGVSLVWRANGENDFDGYRVYRMKEGETEPTLLSSVLLRMPVFSDGSVEKNTLYVYSITSVDKSGNESQPGKIQVRT